MASILRAGLQPATPRTPTLPPIRYATAAAAAVSPPSQQNGAAPPTPSISQASPPTAHIPPEATPSTLSITPSASQSVLQESQLMSSPSLTHPSVTSPMLSSAASHQQDGSFYSGQDSPAISEAVPSSISGPAATSSPQRQQKGTLLIPRVRGRM
jgi:CCR4-NOT transcription complex subunit 3